MNYLITGGLGFIGKNLSLYLSEDKNNNIYIIDNNINDKDFTDRENIYVFMSDITDIVCLNFLLDDISRCQNIDYVIHLAAESGVLPSIRNPIFSNKTNISGTLNILEWSRHSNVKRFIFASSGCVLGNATPPISEKSETKPISPYGVQKLACEHYCKIYNDLFGLNTTILRFSNIYGPLSYHKNSVVSAVLKRIAEKKPVIIFGDGTQTRDFLYIQDLISMIKLVLSDENVGGEIFQLGSGRETSILELLTIIKKFIDIEEIDFHHKREGEIFRSYTDITKFTNRYNWKPRYTIEDGIKETINMWRLL